MITKLLLTQNKRANDAQGEKGRGRQLGSETKCILGLQPREGVISQARACSKRMPCLQPAFSPLYLWGPLETECRDKEPHSRQDWIGTGCHSRRRRGAARQPASFALHQPQERNTVWHPRAHPAICDCKWSTAVRGHSPPPYSHSCPGLEAHRWQPHSHLRAPVRSLTGSQQEQGAA